MSSELAPIQASTVTVAIWPTFTLPISDSLSGTTSCIEERSLKTAKAELLDEPEDEEELEEPSRPLSLSLRLSGLCALAADVLDPDAPEERAARGLGRAACRDDFADLAGERDDRAVLRCVELGVGDCLFVASHGQLVAFHGGSRGGEVRFARGGADGGSRTLRGRASAKYELCRCGAVVMWGFVMLEAL